MKLQAHYFFYWTRPTIFYYYCFFMAYAYSTKLEGIVMTNFNKIPCSKIKRSLALFVFLHIYGGTKHNDLRYGIWRFHIVFFSGIMEWWRNSYFSPRVCGWYIYLLGKLWPFLFIATILLILWITIRIEDNLAKSESFPNGDTIMMKILRVFLVVGCHPRHIK